MKTKFLFLIILCVSLNVFAQNNIHKKVDSLILKRNFELAEKLAKDALKVNSKDPVALCALACVYRNMAYKEVIQFNSASYVRNDTQNASLEISKENLEEMFTPKYYFVDSIFQKSEVIYHDIISVDKHYKDAYMNLINAYENDDEFEKYFETVALYTNNNKNISDTKYVLLELASKLFNKGKLDEALKMYEYTISQYPKFSECISDLGAVYFNRGQFRKARTQFEQSYSLNQNDTLVINNLINLNLVLGDYKKAYQVSEKLVSETKSKFNNFTAGCIASLVEDSKATFYLEKFQNYRKTQINGSIDNDFWFVASKAVKDKPVDVELFEEIVNQFYNNNYHFDLIVFSEILLKKQKDNPYVLQMLTSTFERLKHTEKVLEMLAIIESYNENEAIMPDNALMFNYGRNYFVDKQYQKAIDYMLKVTDEKQMIFVNYLIGESYYHLNDFKNSIKYHKKNSQLNDRENMYYINQSLNRLKELES